MPKYRLATLVCCAFVFSAPPALAELNSCDEPTPKFREYNAAIEAKGLDRNDPEDRLKHAEDILGDTGSGCALTALAHSEMALQQFQLQKYGEAANSANLALASSVLQRAELVRRRKEVISLAAVSAHRTGRVEELLPKFSIEDMDFILELPPEEYWATLFLSVAGYEERAKLRSRTIFEKYGGPPWFVEDEYYQNPPLSEKIYSQINMAATALYQAGASDMLVELVSKMPDSNAPLQSTLLAMAAMHGASDSAAALVAMDEHISRLRQYDDEGYLSPDSSSMLFGSLALTYEAAGEEAKALAVRSAAKKRFGLAFDPQSAISAYLFWRYQPGVFTPDVDFEVAKLAAPITPNWPWEADIYANADCYARFNVDEKGKPFNIREFCNDKRFLKSAANAIKRAEFHPKERDNKPAIQYNVVQPLAYRSMP